MCKVLPLAYELKIPAHKKIHPVVSVQFLSQYPKDLFRRKEPKPRPVEYKGDAPDEDPHYKINYIIQHKDKKGTRLYHVCWRSYSAYKDH